MANFHKCKHPITEVFTSRGPVDSTAHFDGPSYSHIDYYEYCALDRTVCWPLGSTIDYYDHCALERNFWWPLLPIIDYDEYCRIDRNRNDHSFLPHLPFYRENARSWMAVSVTKRQLYRQNFKEAADVEHVWALLGYRWEVSTRHMRYRARSKAKTNLSLYRYWARVKAKTSLWLGNCRKVIGYESWPSVEQLCALLGYRWKISPKPMRYRVRYKANPKFYIYKYRARAKVKSKTNLWPFYLLVWCLCMWSVPSE